MPLTALQIDRAAAILEEARLTVTTIPGLPADVRPHDLRDAYAICERLHERLGWDVAGWYLGATNVEIQRLLGLDGPYMARVYERLLHISPATLDPADFPPMVIECEFAFGSPTTCRAARSRTRARRWPPRSAPCTPRSR